MLFQKRILFLFLILILILFLIYIIKRRYYREYFLVDKEQHHSYYRCKDKELGKITKNIFEENDILNDNENWDIYIPCGYNNVEDELKKMDAPDNVRRKFIFGLNGCDTIVSKNKIWESLLTCYGREYASELMPESFSLDDPIQMTLFATSYIPNMIYILKKNVQRKEGLKLTRNYEDIQNAIYENYRVVQRYITDLYLINHRKVNLRIYLFIVLNEKTISFYVSRKGKCIYTKNPYNDNDLDFESNITSYHLDMNVYKENPRDFDELKKYIDMQDTTSSSYSLQSGEILFENIDLLMKDVSKCLSANFFQSPNIKGSTTFQLFGADVIFDTTLHPYLLEINKGPDMSARDEIDEQMKKEVQEDMFKTMGIIKDKKGDDVNSFYLIYEKNN